VRDSNRRWSLPTADLAPGRCLWRHNSERRYYECKLLGLLWDRQADTLRCGWAGLGWAVQPLDWAGQCSRWTGLGSAAAGLGRAAALAPSTQYPPHPARGWEAAAVGTSGGGGGWGAGGTPLLARARCASPGGGEGAICDKADAAATRARPPPHPRRPHRLLLDARGEADLRLPDHSSLGVLSSGDPAALPTAAPGAVSVHVAAAPIATELATNRYGHKKVSGAGRGGGRGAGGGGRGAGGGGRGAGGGPSPAQPGPTDRADQPTVLPATRGRRSANAPAPALPMRCP
jgi:hypothetical protein